MTTLPTTIAIPSPNAADTRPALPILFAPADERARTRFLEFFAVHIRNPNTRRSYLRGAIEFGAWCEARGVATLAAVQPIHVAAFIEELGQSHSVPTVKAAPRCDPRALRLARRRPGRAGETRPPPFAARAMSCDGARRRCSSQPKRDSFSTPSIRRNP